MIALNELRIGNFIWIDYSGEMIVSAINFQEQSAYHDKCILAKKKPGLPSGLYRITEIEPIKLTTQWLTRLGVNIDSEPRSPQEFFDCMQIYRIKVCKGSEKYTDYLKGFNSNHGIFVEYVHQLQNLYFAVTGKELTVSFGIQNTPV